MFIFILRSRAFVDCDIMFKDWTQRQIIELFFNKYIPVHVVGEISLEMQLSTSLFDIEDHYRNSMRMPYMNKNWRQFHSSEDYVNYKLLKHLLKTIDGQLYNLENDSLKRALCMQLNVVAEFFSKQHHCLDENEALFFLNKISEQIYIAPPCIQLKILAKLYSSNCFSLPQMIKIKEIFDEIWPFRSVNKVILMTESLLQISKIMNIKTEERVLYDEMMQMLFSLILRSKQDVLVQYLLESIVKYLGYYSTSNRIEIYEIVCKYIRGPSFNPNYSW